MAYYGKLQDVDELKSRYIDIFEKKDDTATDNPSNAEDDEADEVEQSKSDEVIYADIDKVDNIFKNIIVFTNSRDRKKNKTLDNIYDAVEEFEENGTLPNENYEKCDSDYFAFKCSFDAYGLKYYAYAFKSGTTREKEMLNLNYLPDICGTELEKKLKAALDEIASTYSETKAN